MNKWWNNGKADGGLLSEDQKQLHAWYGNLQEILTNKAFTRGNYYPLNHANIYNEHFGRIGDISHSGYWIYAFIRHDPMSGDCFLVASNFHAEASMENVRVLLTEEARGALQKMNANTLSIRDELNPVHTHKQDLSDVLERGILLQEISALSSSIWRIEPAAVALED